MYLCCCKSKIVIVVVAVPCMHISHYAYIGYVAVLIYGPCFSMYLANGVPKDINKIMLLKNRI